MACPKDDSQDDHDGGDGKDAPRNFAVGLNGKIFSWRAYVFGAGQLQFGEFLYLH